jgi:signal transduction histidine kinase
MAAMSDAPREPRADKALTLYGAAAAWAARAFGATRRTLAGPDGPAAAALLLAGAALLQVLLFVHPGEQIAAMVANLLATLPLALVRRRLLVAAWVVTLFTGFEAMASPKWLTISALAAQFAVAYLVAAERRRRASVLLAVPVVFSALVSVGAGNVVGVFLLMLVVAAQVAGDARRQRGHAVAERDETRREQAAMEERARIARELHDVVAHHVSMVAVQAETARLTTLGMPEEGRERLAAIGDTARDALTEMRRLLGVLRADAAGEAERAPQPGLAQLEGLLEGARSAGTSVRLRLEGRAVPLPPGVDLTAYRIVQEALTNARRHAPGAEVTVALRFADDALRLSVRDDGPVGEPGPDGHGLLGMRERVATVGGTLSAGPLPTGGFAVDAELPLGEPEP